MKKIFTTAALVLLAGYTYGQQNFKPGYIVNLEGDTLRGLVNYKNEAKNALSCNFKPTETAEIKDFAPTELKGYGFTGSRIYESRKAVIVKQQLSQLNKFEEIPVKGQPAVNFMNALVKGKATLYLLVDNTGQSHYYLQKDSAALQELYHFKSVVTDPKTGAKQMHSSKQYVGVFTIAFQDCPAMAPKIQKAEFKESDLMNLVKDYNQCINPEQKVITLIKPETKATWGALVGGNYAKVSIKDNDILFSKGDFKSDPTLTGGIFLDVPLPKLNEKLSLHNGLMYVKRNYYANFDVAGDYNYYHHNYDITFDLQYIRLVNLLRYTFPSGALRPFFNAGLSNGLMISGKQSKVETYYRDNAEPKKYEPVDALPAGFRKYERGLIAGIGLLRELPSKKQLTLETRYEYSNGFTKGMGVSSAASNVSVLVGFGL